MAVLGVVALLTTAAPAQAIDTFGRIQAADAAKKFWNVAGEFSLFGSDCTNFVSQALWAGGLPTTSEWTPRTSDPAKTHAAVQ